MAWSWGNALSGAGSGAAAGMSAGPWGAVAGGLLGLLGGFSGDDEGGGEGVNMQQLMDEIMGKYSYQPQYTAQTEASLFDLFQRLTGQGKYGGVESIPFDIGLPTTGLYDALTRGIKQDYLGTPGGPEGGKIADLRAYYNNLGIPEQAVNQERLGYQDMNNSLLDQAALINESQKDRLTNILNMGLGTGSNLYSQNLNQHRFNTGQMSNALAMDYGLTDAINQSNNNNLMSLLLNSGSMLGSKGSYGSNNGTGITSLLGNIFGGQTQKNSPYLFGNKSNSTTAKLIS